MKRTVIRITIFILLLAAVLLYCNSILFPKYGDGIYDLKKFYELEDNTVDVLFLGNSRCFENFSTGTLWDEYGIAAFDLGGSNQPPWNTYHYLKEALKTQHPKLIVMEASNTKQYEDYSAQQYIVKNNFGLKWSRNKVDSLLASIRKEARFTYIPEWLRYHYRYTDVEKADFVKDQGNPLYRDWKGFACNFMTYPTEGKDLSGITEVGYLSEKSEWYYNHIIELAQQEGIPIEIVIAPYSDCYEDEMKAFNRTRQIAEEKGVPFMNCVLMTEEMGLDYSVDMADPVHLNYRGSSKFSSFIGRHISENYDIPDRRGEAGYESWQRHADYIRRMISDQKLRECTDVGEYLDIISSESFDGYEVFLSIENAEGDYGQVAKNVLDGFDAGSVETAGVWHIRNGKVVWGAAGDDRDHYQDLPFSSIHLKKADEDDEEGNRIIADNRDCKVRDGFINIVIYDNVTASVEDSVAIIPGEAGQVILERKEEQTVQSAVTGGE
ncbi:MAG: hypothetical protein K6E49_07655 [Lachnospiraceae bacterium]|nr:hypothetical protein [Lachnospiraceae bacterium]